MRWWLKSWREIVKMGCPCMVSQGERERKWWCHGGGRPVTESFVPESGRRTTAESCLELPGRGSEREQRGDADGTKIVIFLGCDIIERIPE
jgi:hypothetical protein